jgi:transglutaminase-like putative cysteine protease
MFRTLSFRCVVAALLLLPAAARAQFDTRPPSDGGSALGEARTQKWEFGVSIRAVGGPSVGLFSTIPVPAEWPEQQVKLVGEEVTPNVRRHSYRELEGLKQLVVEVPQLAPGDTATCFVTLEITRHALVPPADTASLVVPKNPPRDVRKWLGASPYIEVSNARIRTLARELTDGQESAWQQVGQIAEGVRERVKHEPVGNDKFKGALGAIRDGQAGKEDMTSAFVAICRAAKIPARTVWAIDYVYAEFYLEDAMGKGAWYPCVVHENVELGAVKDLRPILEKGDNFRVPENKDPQRFVSEYLTGKGGGGRPSVEFRRRTAD